MQGSHPHLGAPASSPAPLLAQPVWGHGTSPGPGPSSYISSSARNRSHPSHSLASLQRPAQKSQALDVTNYTIKNKKIQRNLVSNVSLSRLLRSLQSPPPQQEEGDPRTPKPGAAPAPFTPTAARVPPEHPVPVPETSRGQERARDRGSAAPPAPPQRAGPFPTGRISLWDPALLPPRDPKRQRSPAAAPNHPLTARGGVPPPALGPTTAPHRDHAATLGVPRAAGARSPHPGALPARDSFFPWLSSRDSPRLGTTPPRPSSYQSREEPPSKLIPPRQVTLPRARRDPPAQDRTPPALPPSPHSPAHQLPAPLARRLTRGHPGAGGGAGAGAGGERCRRAGGAAGSPAGEGGDPHRQTRPATRPGGSAGARTRTPAPRGLGRLRRLLRAPAPSGTGREPGGTGREGEGGSHHRAVTQSVTQRSLGRGQPRGRGVRGRTRRPGSSPGCGRGGSAPPAAGMPAQPPGNAGSPPLKGLEQG